MAAAFASNADRAALMAAKPRRVPGSMRTRNLPAHFHALLSAASSRGLRQLSQRVRNRYQIMLFTRKTGTQVLPEPLGLRNNRGFALLGKTFARGNPATANTSNVGCRSCGNCFHGSEQRCTWTSAKIKHAGNFFLRRTQLDFGKRTAGWRPM